MLATMIFSRLKWDYNSGNIENFSLFQMTTSKRIQYHNIPIQIDGKTKIVKSVTKTTTCTDVINKLPKTDALLAVFRSVNGGATELAGKTKLLKVWRSYGSAEKVTFIVKKSEGRKERRLSLNIFGGRNNRKSIVPVSKDKIKQVSDLAFYIQYQKSKLQKMTTQETPGRKTMQKIKSTSSVDSMDAFLAKADLQKMGQFLDFCSDVTASHLGGTPKHKEEPEIPREKVSKYAIRDSLRTMKLGFKRTLTSKLSFASKTTSASTLKSTDTGYQSVGSDMRSGNSAESLPPKRRDCLNGIPLHSTPVTGAANRGLKRENADDTLDVTLTTPKAAKFDEEEGKSVLLRRFMADTTICEAKKRSREASGRVRGFDISTRHMYASAPVLFRSQEEKCRFYWNKNCDSDSDSSFSDVDSFDEAADLDEAFVEDITKMYDEGRMSSFNDVTKPGPRKLRRESAVSNLNMFEFCPKTFESTYFDGETENNDFNYSFDCSFPEFSDSQDFSLDYSCSETESDSSSSFENNYFRRVNDDDFCSFIASKESLVMNESSKFFVPDTEEKRSEVGSDEGVGSMASDSFSEDPEFFI